MRNNVATAATIKAVAPIRQATMKQTQATSDHRYRRSLTVSALATPIVRQAWGTCCSGFAPGGAMESNRNENSPGAACFIGTRRRVSLQKGTDIACVHPDNYAHSTLNHLDYLRVENTRRRCATSKVLCHCTNHSERRLCLCLVGFALTAL